MEKGFIRKSLLNFVLRDSTFQNIIFLSVLFNLLTGYPKDGRRFEKSIRDKRRRKTFSLFVALCLSNFGI